MLPFTTSLSVTKSLAGCCQTPWRVSNIKCLSVRAFRSKSQQDWKDKYLTFSVSNLQTNSNNSKLLRYKRKTGDIREGGDAETSCQLKHETGSCRETRSASPCEVLKLSEIGGESFRWQIDLLFIVMFTLVKNNVELWRSWASNWRHLDQELLLIPSVCSIWAASRRRWSSVPYRMFEWNLFRPVCVSWKNERIKMYKKNIYIVWLHLFCSGVSLL